MTANVDAMVRAGIDAYRSGNKIEARALLEKAIELDDYNEQAWLWLSAVVETPEEQQTCLENVLVINPDSTRARQGLKMLGVDPDAGGGSEGLGQSPFTDTNFDASSGFDDSDFSVAPTASSSASATFKGDDLSSKDYDNWVAGLNLGSEDAASTPTATPVADETDSIFGSGDFGDFDSSSFDDSGFTSGPIGASSDIDFGFDDPAVTVKPSPSADDLLADFRDAEIATSPTDDAPIRSPAPTFSPSPGDFGGGDFITSDIDEVEPEELSPEEYFAFIPKEIKATRLPGTNEGAPIVLILVLLIAIGLNVGAVALLVSKLA